MKQAKAMQKKMAEVQKKVERKFKVAQEEILWW